MKTEVLLHSIGQISDELIADAESEANTKRKPGWAKLGIMAACLALVLCTGIATHAIRSNATAGTFTMDVNPSVEYTIAKSGIVKNVRCLNSDAENALSDVALGKQSVETALTRTVAAYEACGYLENGEGCLSVKDEHPGHVFRHARIKVRGYDLIQDKNVTISAEGYFAIALQHEIDHLSGILFYDRIDENDPWKEDPEAEVI